MTIASAQAALDRMEDDDAFAISIRDAGSSTASLQILTDAGFDVTPEEMKDATLDRYGDALTVEQLDQLAGGISKENVVGLAVLGTSVGIAAVGAAAAAV